MVDHILLTRAHRSPHRERPDVPGDVEYDAVAGYWRKDGVPLWATNAAMPLTKKNDIETGEDMKGE